jgi:hypothetical protein
MNRPMPVVYNSRAGLVVLTRCHRVRTLFFVELADWYSRGTECASFHFNRRSLVHSFMLVRCLFLVIVYISAFGVLMDMSEDG